MKLQELRNYCEGIEFKDWALKLYGSDFSKNQERR